jgi:microcystin-dependent protein
MAEIKDLSTSAASNTTRFPENMQFRNVNDSARELEAMIAREFKDRNMTLTASGSSGAFTVTTNQTITSLYDGLVIGFQANHSITGAATLNVNSLGAKSIVAQSGTALGSGDIVNGQKVLVVYRSASNDFQIVGGRVAGSSADTLARLIDVGTVMAWPTSTLPTGWLECDGSAISRTTYSQLFAKLGTIYGVGDGSTTFNLPDYRGQFLRGHANGSSTDPDRASRTDRGDGTTGDSVGTKQAGATASHTHSVTGTTSTDGAHTHTVAYAQPTNASTGGALSVSQLTGATFTQTSSSNGSHSHTVTGTAAATGGSETRPTNVAVKFIILALPAAASAATLGVNGLLYTWDTGTTAADPGTGKLRVNNATVASATALYINETGADGCGYGPLIATWDDSTATNKGKLHIYKVGSLSTFAIFTITGTLTDSGTYDQLSLTYVTGNGTFASGDQLAVIFVPNGDAGAAGSTGAAGTDAGIRWTFATSTTMGDPSSGNVRFNNATPASVTAIAISRNSAESGNPSMSAWINTWDDSSSTTKGQIVVRDLTDATNQLVFAITAVTDNTTWLQLTVSLVSGSSLPAASDSLAFSFYRTGDQGASGSGSGDVTGQASSVDGEIALFSSTTGKVIKRATGSGLVKIASGVMSTAASGTDYAPATSGSAILKGNGAGGFGSATSGTDYAPATSGSAILKGNGSGGFSAAAAGTDYVAATSGSAVQKANGSGGLTAATAGTDYMAPGTTSLVTVGFTVTPNNIGTVSSGTTTPAAASGNYQYLTNNGAFTLAAPAADCAIDLLVTNGASAGAITFSGFTVSASTGDSLTTTNTSKFVISIRRINAVSTYIIKALQ